MTALERLIANINSVIGFLETFSSSEAADVTFTYINDDDTEEDITFANIKKFQESVNVFLGDDGNFVDIDGNKITIDADTLDGKTAAEISTSTALKFKMLLDTSVGSFSERWMWGVTENNEIVHVGRSINGVNSDIGATDSACGYSIIPQPNSKKDVLIEKIFATSWNGFVLYEDGDLYGIGLGTYGGTGQGNTAQQSDLVHILSDVDSVASSSQGYYQNYNTYVAIKTDGSVWTWGQNGYGQCGNGTTTDQLSPGERTIDGLNDDETIVKAYVCDTERSSTYLLSDQGRVFACGYNANGELGLGDSTNRTEFALVSGALSDKFVSSLSVAGGTRVSTSAYYENSVVALTDSGELFGWGHNSYGELGLGNTTDYNLPQQIFIDDADGTFVSVIDSFGSYTSRIALTDSGEAWGWGNNTYGCLGSADGGTLSTPFKITLYDEDGSESTSSITNAIIISSGQYSYFHTTLIFTEEGKMYSAGYGVKGQLARNTITSDTAFTEARFDYASDVAQISFGGNSGNTAIYALLSDGRVFSWGNNTYYQTVVSRTDTAVCNPTPLIQ